MAAVLTFKYLGKSLIRSFVQLFTANEQVYFLSCVSLLIRYDNLIFHLGIAAALVAGEEELREMKILLANVLDIKGVYELYRECEMRREIKSV